MDDACLVAEITDCLSLRFGSGVAAWCSAVPALADEVAGRWRLTLGDRYAYGASSVVLYCSLAGGRRAVLKLSPDPPFLADQAAMLGLFAPSGKVPDVLAVDPAALHRGRARVLSLARRIVPGHGVPFDVSPAVPR